MKIKGFTMVEMLAVVAVIAIVAALVVPNAVFLKSTGESSVARTQKEIFEAGMRSYFMKEGNAAQTAWSSAVTSLQASSGSARIAGLFNTLQRRGNLPTSATASQFQQAWNGYTVTFPTTLTGELTFNPPLPTAAPITP